MTFAGYPGPASMVTVSGLLTSLPRGRFEKLSSYVHPSITISQLEKIPKLLLNMPFVRRPLETDRIIPSILLTIRIMSCRK